MKKFIIKTLGCKVNQYDSLTLRKLLLEAGFENIQENSSETALVIVNSCAVTKTSIAKGRRLFSATKRENPNAKTVLLGCWAKIYPEEVKKLDADLIWGVGGHEKLVAEVEKLFDFNIENAQGVENDSVRKMQNEKKGFLEILSPGEGERARYSLKIQDGCQQFCSYCIIPYSRGKLSSKPKNEVLDEIRVALAVGYKEIVLCGIHLGLYGKEKDSTACSLRELLAEIIKIERLGRVRLSSTEVVDVDDEILELMATSDKICRHLHFPLQSGSDKILKAMNRQYLTDYFKKRVWKARKLMPNLAVTTDVIVGFPGETDEEFEKTVQFCKEIGFSRMHIFQFSAHEKTPAAKMEGQIEKMEKKKRMQKLKKVAEMMKQKYENSFSGQELAVIIEATKTAQVLGKSEFYFDLTASRDFFKHSKTPRIGSLQKMTKKI
jgi:threonylcarbamoyladenosine tRNA methylthiotransferase MtaB